ncbi:apoptosis-inducing factor 2-like [Asterias rubens]|uniref:apoptosis-inducing factor 2-like n=1 Tax=Asterias rubens TaxID=7604 RepID=UPI00145553B6|nr:apoptosis-inducing factor 2-like [Asterias rubens]XP_033637580.1 apoptosis-inducing factor 2-like [Asterias rubens]
MGSSHSLELESKRVVIIGGGYGGVAAANKLLGKCQLTLIDSKEAFHHCLAALRACTEDGLAGKTFIPYEPTYGKSFKRGTVVAILVDSKEVLLSGGESIGYDYLIIGTGSQGGFPGNVEGGEDTDVYVSKYTGMLQKVKLAKEIVVIGGGAVGLEMAGEIATDFPDKSVTVVHSRDYLVEGDSLRPAFRDGIKDQLTAKGVKLVLGEKVSNLNDIPRDGSSKCTVKTNKGTEIQADLAIVCIGKPVKSSTTYSKSLQSSMTERGQIRVNEHLQVEGLTDVFAIGDCSESGAGLAYVAGAQGELAADNIWYSVEKRGLKSWKSMGVMMILPIGRNGGMFQVGNWVFGTFLSRKIKSEHLFLPKYWGEMKQTMPTETCL